MKVRIKGTIEVTDKALKDLTDAIEFGWKITYRDNVVIDKLWITKRDKKGA
jgi:hypothetical protein